MILVPNEQHLAGVIETFLQILEEVFGGHRTFVDDQENARMHCPSGSRNDVGLTSGEVFLNPKVHEGVDRSDLTSSLRHRIRNDGSSLVRCGCDGHGMQGDPCILVLQNVLSDLADEIGLPCASSSRNVHVFLGWIVDELDNIKECSLLTLVKCHNLVLLLVVGREVSPSPDSDQPHLE